jgi:hypothetical protein
LLTVVFGKEAGMVVASSLLDQIIRAGDGA